MRMTFACDEGPGAGLGHRRRVEALAAELAVRGHDCALSSLSAAGVVSGDLVVVDSYRVRADAGDRFRADFVVAVDDLARDLAVDIVVDPSPGADGAAHTRARRVLAGAAFALVPPADPGTRSAAIDAPVEQVLVTTGAADAGGVGALVAASVLAAMPAVEIRLVVGPWGANNVPAGVVALESPDGLAGEIAAAGIVVTAGGVTMLEACRSGRPVVALALADNQRQAVAGLAAQGAVLFATVSSVAAAVSELARDRGARLALATAASASVDGKGAARVADAIEQLVSR
jgi:UDP-2,4-diacetamido-2,4,6-trideoxy-beta-L-altropyranose hydrolase